MMESRKLDDLRWQVNRAKHYIDVFMKQDTEDHLRILLNSTQPLIDFDQFMGEARVVQSYLESAVETFKELDDEISVPSVQGESEDGEAIRKA